MPRTRASAGLLMYRTVGEELQVLLAHPGGPFFRTKDEGAWMIPKGEVGPGEDLMDTAVREFQEEIGAAPTGPYLPLTPVKQRGGKSVHAWAFEGDCDPGSLADARALGPTCQGRRQGGTLPDSRAATIC